MLQRLRQDLTRYHELFRGGRCSGWELEELLVNAIKSDTQAQHHVRWKEAGHDDRADIEVFTNGEPFFVQVKSGQLTSQYLKLSGYRLGRFNGDLKKITQYLNEHCANILAVPCQQVNDKTGRRFIYRVCYVRVEHLQALKLTEWTKEGKAYKQVNQYGTVLNLRPSMSWQIWWDIPLSLFDTTIEIVID